MALGDVDDAAGGIVIREPMSSHGAYDHPRSGLAKSAEEQTEQLAALISGLQQLGRSEQRFQCLVQATSQIIWTNSPDGYMEGMQPGWSAFTGQTLEEYRGFGWAKAVHPEDAQPTIDAWNLAVSRRSIFIFEHRVRRSDGQYCLFSIRGVPVLNDDGSIREWVGVHSDITEQRQKEQELSASESKYRFLAESMPQIVWTAKPDGSIDYYNQRWFEYTGMTPEQAHGWGWKPIIHPDDMEACVRTWTEAIGSGEPYQIELRFKRGSDGSYRWHLGLGLPLKDESGAVLKWFGSCTDVNDYKEAEAANLRLNDQLEERVRHLQTANSELRLFSRRLEQSNRELQDFVSVASHDLQEPLRKLQAFGRRLKTAFGEFLDDQGRDYLHRMLNTSKRMQGLIDDLLAFSRVSSQALPFVAVNLTVIAGEVLSGLGSRIAETHAVVEIGDLPTIEADPAQMRLLLHHLIENGLKFHKIGEVPNVRICAENVDNPQTGGRMCRLKVEDNGIGFDEKYLDRIFTVFQRLHGRGEYEGTGVGLTICRKIAERHGGEITAISAPNRGSAFIVTIPRHQSAC